MPCGFACTVGVVCVVDSGHVILGRWEEVPCWVIAGAAMTERGVSWGVCAVKLMGALSRLCFGHICAARFVTVTKGVAVWR